MSKKTPAAPAKAAAKPAKAAPAEPTKPTEPAAADPAAAPQPQADEPQAQPSEAKAVPEVLDPVPTSTHAPRLPIDRLERARALPELKNTAAAKPAGEPIQSFKDEDRRTMNVVTVAGELFKQAV